MSGRGNGHDDGLSVRTQGLTKRFGDLVAVDQVDLTVTTGTVLALLGPNGAGKTTIVRMLATLTTPNAGDAWVCGHHTVREADQVRRLISLTGQFAALEDNLTARENLMLMARLRGYHRTAAGRIVDALIDRFDIGEFRDTLTKSVSGGQRRRSYRGHVTRFTFDRHHLLNVIVLLAAAGVAAFV